MADVRWTADQADAIAARGGSLLISAAAGSGKTAVLVERVIGLLTDPVNPVAADRLLIVTFTRAAAAEMRGRLEKKLYQMSLADPQNLHLKRQRIRLSQATIGTMHGFCGDCIRSYFHELGISPGFRIIADQQQGTLKAEAVTEAIEEGIQTPEGQILADALSDERNDRGLMEAVLQLHSYQGAHPQPKAWLDRVVDRYTEQLPVGKSPWGQVILLRTVQITGHLLSLMDRVRDLVQGDPKLEGAFLPLVEAEARQMAAVRAAAEGGSWQESYQAVHGFSFGPLKTPRGYAQDAVKERAKHLRDLWRDGVKKQLQPLYPIDEEDCRTELEKLGELARALQRLTEDFARRYQEKKAERDFFDYEDLEHQMLRLVADRQGQPSKISKEIAAGYDAVMIDEFQDINAVQELIFRSVSQGGENLFMVGDVKQSIYGFRQAMPEIFLETRSRYGRYHRERPAFPAYIVLDRNFRSRKTVTESVNFVFSQIMRKSCGELDYSREEELVYGAAYPEKSGCETELHILERSPDQSIEAVEGQQIAARIWGLIRSGFTVTDHGTERPVEFQDFCILLRSANTHAHDYALVLAEYGIPARAALPGGFFAAREVGLILSFLRVIDNPDQDIPLLTVLMSPVYGLDPGDLLALRQSHPTSSLYLAFLEEAETDPRYREIAGEIALYRADCVTLSAESFLDLLYRRTGYPEMVRSMEEGETRLANLQLLQKYARDYERSGVVGMSGFVRYLDRLKENRWDLKGAELTGDLGGSVQIMSVHKSKGLEFPVCFVAGCDRSLGNHGEQLLLHPDLGMGIRLTDREMGVRYRTMSREAVALDNARRASAEEMRILYVAMTRAREKLILVSAMKNPVQRLQALANQIDPEGISDYAVQSAKSFSDWLLLCALRHPQAEALRDLAEAEPGMVNRAFFSPWQFVLEKEVPDPVEAQGILSGREGTGEERLSLEEIEKIFGHLESAPKTSRALAETEVRFGSRTSVGESQGDSPQAEEKPEAIVPDPTLMEAVNAGIRYRYPYEALTEIPAKVTASGLSARKNRTRWRQPLSRPLFLMEEGMTSAERGTALHHYMQYADFHEAAADPERERNRLLTERFLTAEEGAAVELIHIRRFFEGPLGQRVLRAKEMQKERRFSVEIPAGTALKEVAEEFADTKIVLQGSIDCSFVEAGKLHIIDFKTDRISSLEALKRQYTDQLTLYADAMRAASGYPIGDQILYSMYLDEEILVGEG